jgi:hypothetical protein
LFLGDGLAVPVEFVLRREPELVITPLGRTVFLPELAGARADLLVSNRRLL